KKTSGSATFWPGLADRRISDMGRTPVSSGCDQVAPAAGPAPGWRFETYGGTRAQGKGDLSPRRVILGPVRALYPNLSERGSRSAPCSSHSLLIPHRHSKAIFLIPCRSSLAQRLAHSCSPPLSCRPWVITLV